MSREAFGQKLSEIKADITRLGMIAENMVELAVQAAVNDDEELAAKVKEMESELDRGEKEAIEKILITVLREQPVARDLVLLTSNMSVVSEIEKAGDHAWKLARRSIKLTLPFPDHLKALLIEMGSETRQLFRSAIIQSTEFDSEMADELLDLDDKIDRKFKAARSELVNMMSQTPEDARQLLRCSEIFHALEHIADQAVYILKTLKMHRQPTA